MNQNDREFLEEMMQERMTRIYAIDHIKRKDDIQRFTALEEKLNHALDLLPEEHVKGVRQYMEYLFQQDAEKEVFFYRNGLLDGYRLCRHIQSVLESA